MSCSKQQAVLAEAQCEIRFDNLTRRLYATDASIYQVMPLGVAFPRTALEASSTLRAAANAGVSVIPRGAGTGLVGGAIGDGLVIDFARHLRQIAEFNREKRTIRVGAGMVLDQLNAFLRPHGLRFGPDVATGSRATIGGMVANNSSGSHTPVYGTTADHVLSLELLLADSRIQVVGPGHDGMAIERDRIRRFVSRHEKLIAERMPPDLLKRWPGYGLDRFARDPDNLCHLIAGSEGTLAGIMSAELRLVPLPSRQGVAVIFFASIAEAMQATVELLDLKPAAIEHVDRALFDQTKNQLSFKAARDLLALDALPCESFLIVEFFDDEVESRLDAVAARKLGQRTLVLKNAHEANLVWNMRKAGLALLTGRAGDAKPTTGVEDTAVRPAQLPAYVAALESVFKPLDLEVCYYGHAASGLLHVRPVLDMHRAEDIRKFRQVMNEVSAIVRQFKGSLAAEHGVGVARTEFMEEHLGPELYRLSGAIKNAFDPGNRLNPGKVVQHGVYRCDENLRLGPDHELTLPFEPVLAFAAKDGSFVRNLEQCNGCGGCRKETPTMCPTFLATGEEIMSTRGRANVIRSALDGDLSNGFDGVFSAEVEIALAECLSCKACTAECPSNVNMALLKAELLHARQQRDGLSLRVRALSAVDLFGRVASMSPTLANWLLYSPLFRQLTATRLGFTLKRSLPAFASQRFDTWFLRRTRARPTASRGKIILWDDCFARYFDPEIGKAATTVLEAAGFEVTLLRGRKCCGRPAFSQGNLTEAARVGRHNLRLLSSAADDAPIVFLEPSCWSMFADDYRELKLEGASDVARRAVLFEKFIGGVLQDDAKALAFNEAPRKVAVHAHCHMKALSPSTTATAAFDRIPNCETTLLDTGCCGMAGAFGMLEDKYDLSIKIAEPLIQRVRQLPKDVTFVASGTSCRQQVEHLLHRRPKHAAEVIADALARPR